MRIGCDREQTAHLQRPVAPRQVRTQIRTARWSPSIDGVGHDCRRVGLAEFTSGRSDLSMHLRFTSTWKESISVVGLIDRAAFSRASLSSRIAALTFGGAGCLAEDDADVMRVVRHAPCHHRPQVLAFCCHGHAGFLPAHASGELHEPARDRIIAVLALITAAWHPDQQRCR